MPNDFKFSPMVLINVLFRDLTFFILELAKVKEFEVQTIKALFNTPTLTASTVKGRKEWDNLVKFMIIVKFY